MKDLILIVIMIMVIFISYIFYINYYNSDIHVFSHRDNIFTARDYKSLKIMTYNIHHGVGIDNQLNLERTANIIKHSEAQIIGLNEVDNRMMRTNFQKQSQILADFLSMNYVYGPTLKYVFGSYGNAILTSFPIKEIKNHKLPVSIGDEPRALLEAEVIISSKKSLRILVTHLSFKDDARKKQLNWLNHYLEDINEPFVLMGDFNSELNFSNNMNFLLKTNKTYPTKAPEKKIDMFFSNCKIKQKSYTINTDASDHLPLLMEIIP